MFVLIFVFLPLEYSSQERERLSQKKGDDKNTLPLSIQRSDYLLLFADLGFHRNYFQGKMALSSFEIVLKYFVFLGTHVLNVVYNMCVHVHMSTR